MPVPGREMVQRDVYHQVLSRLNGDWLFQNAMKTFARLEHE